MTEMNEKNQKEKDDRDLAQLMLDVAALVGDVKLALKESETEEKVKHYLFARFGIGRKAFFTDDQGEKHEFIITSWPMRCLTRKISFGKTLWYHDMISWVLRKICGDERARAILRRTLGRRKLPQYYDDGQAIACYEGLFEALSRYKAKDIERRLPLFWQRRRVNACIRAFIRAI